MKKDFSSGRARGLTLLELLVALAVLTLLMVIGVPQFGHLLTGIRLGSAMHELVTTLHFARSEAIKRGSRVTLCKSADGTACAESGGWEQGWVVFADTADFGDLNEGEPVFRSRGEIEGDLSIQGNQPLASYISYSPVGITLRASGAFQAGSLFICDPRSIVEGYTIVVSKTGRPRTTHGGCD